MHIVGVSSLHLVWIEMGAWGCRGIVVPTLEEFHVVHDVVMSRVGWCTRKCCVSRDGHEAGAVHFSCFSLTDSSNFFFPLLQQLFSIRAFDDQADLFALGEPLKRCSDCVFTHRESLFKVTPKTLEICLLRRGERVYKPFTFPKTLLFSLASFLSSFP
jgi:hypothetical protein